LRINKIKSQCIKHSVFPLAVKEFTMKFNRTDLSSYAVLLAMIASLGACGKQTDDRTVGQKIDSGVEAAQQRGEQAMDQTATAIESTAQKVAASVTDAAITTAVKAELAKDNTLSATQIEVETQGGRVALTGKAPDALSIERATRLVSGIDGVKSVDNRLMSAVQ
jgi:hyperosmotically inducible periplasmic protein